MGTFLVVLGGVIALAEALVFDVSEASWGAAILIIGTFLLIVSVIVDLTVFLGQLIWQCLVWGWQSLFG